MNEQKKEAAAQWWLRMTETYRKESQKEDSIVRFGQTWFTIFKDMNNE